MDVTIREATTDDAAAITALLNPIISAGCYTIMTEPITLDRQVEWMQNTSARGVIHVAVDCATQIVGIQSIEPVSSNDALQHVGDISTFVAFDCMRQGIGQRLSGATISVAHAKGFRKVLAMIRADNPDAVAFYQQQGFIVAGTLREHVRLRDRYVDEVVAELMLE